MTTTHVTTQAEWDAAIERGDTIEVATGEWEASGTATVRASGTATVRAYGTATVHASGTATVRAYGTATVRAYGSVTVRAYGTATVHASDTATVRASGTATVHAYGTATVRAYGTATVRAYDTATVHASGTATVHASDTATVRAYDTATVHAYDTATVHAYDTSTVRAYDTATVRAYDTSTVRAYGSVTVRAYDTSTVAFRHSTSASIDAINVIEAMSPGTIEEWLDRYEITPTTDGIVTLFKAVDDAFQSPRGGDYTPGSTPVAPDWDEGASECGGGLHFSPTPHHALSFNADAVRFVACPVAVADIRPPQVADVFPAKVKARGCSGPVRECSITGEDT